MKKIISMIVVLALCLIVMGIATDALAAQSNKKNPHRFVDNGDGTISDNQTGLMWEKKTGSVDSAVFCITLTDCPDPHNVNNIYRWSFSGTDPDGTLFTDFLTRINKALSTSDDGSRDADVCFAGHCDWRLPNIVELRTIQLAQSLCNTIPCIDAIFGPTAVVSGYWSSTSVAFDPNQVWEIPFGVGDDGSTRFGGGKMFSDSARAVRGGR